jgi:hypothetical protein
MTLMPVMFLNIVCSPIANGFVFVQATAAAQALFWDSLNLVLLGLSCYKLEKDRIAGIVFRSAEQITPQGWQNNT